MNKPFSSSFFSPSLHRIIQKGLLKFIWFPIQSRLHRTLSRWIFNIPKGGYFTSSLSNYFKYLTTPCCQYDFCLLPNNFICCHLYLLPLSSCHVPPTNVCHLLNLPSGCCGQTQGLPLAFSKAEQNLLSTLVLHVLQFSKWYWWPFHGLISVHGHTRFMSSLMFPRSPRSSFGRVVT